MSICRPTAICIILSLLQPVGLLAQQGQPLSKHAAKIERQVSANTLGDEITVFAQQSSVVCGRLSSIHADSFEFLSVTDGTTTTLSYDKVRKVMRGCPNRYPHSGRNTARMIAWLGGPIVIAVVIIVVAAAHD